MATTTPYEERRIGRPTALDSGQNTRRTTSGSGPDAGSEVAEDLVVRIVYDGPPLAGKTTSMRQLAKKLGSSVVTPEEIAGRTVYFDWLDYVGGAFDGRPIRCQIIGVPGQDQFVRRRRHILEQADAVVFVMDTRREAFDLSLAMLAEIAPRCQSREPPVGIVIQANKQDAPDRVPTEELLEAVQALSSAPVVDTAATRGSGVRESFVFAVRLALDRVAAMQANVQSEAPKMRSAEHLLEQLALEAPRRTRAVTDRSRRDQEVVFRVDPDLPSGFVWPPVDGRMRLKGVADAGLDVAADADGNWWATAGSWKGSSLRQMVYPNAEAGRKTLVDWARLHGALHPHLSPDRLLVLAEAGRGRTRLWQLVRASTSIADRLERVLSEGSRALVVDWMRFALRCLIETPIGRNQPSPFSWRLENLDCDADGTVTYVHFVEPNPTEGVSLETLLTPWVERLQQRRSDGRSILKELDSLNEFPWSSLATST
ncbi:MAG: ADP-ribosylation factor-like protein [Myxococcota bacterium]